jgi:uncharacterized protein YwqG
VSADRRGFFKDVLREVAGFAREIQDIRTGAEPVFEPEAWEPPRPVQASPARWPVDEEALRALCRDVGLEGRTDDVVRMARPSIRLTPGGTGVSRLGGSPDLPPDFEWPTWEDRELAFVGQLALDEVAALEPTLPIPNEGRLLVFWDFEGKPSGVLPAHRGSCRVVVVDADPTDLIPDDAHAQALRPMQVELSRELTVPSPWTFPAEALDLSTEEAGAWDTLRERLAEAQGVELEDASPDTFALHRLLGYQEEVGSELEFDCELAASGLDAGDYDVYYEVRTERTDAALEWRLLLQVSADDTMGTPGEGEFDRLFICIRDADLQAGNLDAAWAILR